MAWTWQRKKVISARVESDSMIAINLIRNGCNKEHPAFQLVQAALRLTEGMETVLWQHTWREANQVADTLAKYSLSLSNDCKIFDQVPGFLVMPLMADFNVVSIYDKAHLCLVCIH